MIGSIKAYARHRKELGLSGGTDTAVHKQIAKGRIQRLADGQIDFEAADAAWAGNVLQVTAAETAGKRLEDQVSADAADVAPAVTPPRQTIAKNAVRAKAIDDINVSRAKREAAEARIAERKDQEQAGELLRKLDVQRMYAEIGRTIGAARGTIPGQLAPMLVGKTDVVEITRVIRQELMAADNRACQELEARFPNLFHEAEPTTAAG